MPDVTYSARYRQSHALIIGIDDYAGRLPPLLTAQRGAEAIASTLRDDFGFDTVITLTDAAATQRAIRRALTDPLSRREKVGPDDRVVIYFAGHGLTYDTVYGEVGYIAPVDGDPQYEDTLIAMDELTRTASNRIHAKHVLFLLDACFSGFATTRMSEAVERQYRDFMTRRARQVITAGTREQAASDEWGPEGHSLFTGFLLDGLRGAAPMPGGMLRAFHVAGFVQDQVAQHSRSQQTPQYAPLLGSQGGDFIFDVRQVSELPEWVRAASDSNEASQRLVAVSQLRDLLQQASPGQRSGLALAKLEQMAANDPDPLVRSSARTALEGLSMGAQVAPQVREEPLDTGTDWPAIPAEPDRSQQATIQSMVSPRPSPPPETPAEPQRRGLPTGALIGGAAALGLVVIVIAGVVLIGLLGGEGTPISDATQSAEQTPPTTTPTEDNPDPTPTDEPQEGALDATAFAIEESPEPTPYPLGSATRPLTIEMVREVDLLLNIVAQREVGLLIDQSGDQDQPTKVDNFCEGITHAGFYSPYVVMAIEERGCPYDVLAFIDTGSGITYDSYIVSADPSFAANPDWGSLSDRLFCRVDASSTVGWVLPELYLRGRGVDIDAMTIYDVGGYAILNVEFEEGTCDLGATFDGTNPGGIFNYVDNLGPFPNLTLVISPEVDADLQGSLLRALEIYLNEEGARYPENYTWVAYETADSGTDLFQPFRTLLQEADQSAGDLLD